MKERETKRPKYCRTMKQNTDKKTAKKSESTGKKELQQLSLFDAAEMLLIENSDIMAAVYSEKNGLSCPQQRS